VSLWEWAVSVYQSDEVPDICLRLQDEHGQNTSLLLWAIWGSPADAQLEQGAGIARSWDSRVLSPLREARRNLRESQPPVDDHAREELREEIMTAELLAERVLMETLETLAPRGTGNALEAAQAASQAWGKAAPRDALEKLTAAVA
jgi:uncharacterized protein (TIGR02444 family)